MRWFKNMRRQKPQRLMVLTVRFVGEQDGPSERRLKECFVEHFRKQATVERAYLALADHGDGKRAHVTLAIRSSSGEDPTLIRKLQSIFSSMFSSHEHLDMMFIQEDEEHQLQGVCKPFYQTSD